MQRRSLLVLTAFALPCLAARVAPSDKLSYGPASGTTLTRAWTIVNQASLDDLQMSMGGNPQPMPGEMEMTQSMTTEIEVTDVIVEMRGGAPKMLKRSFDKLSGNGTMSMSMPPMGDNSTDMTAESDLEGKRVKFSWNEDESKYVASYDESEGDAELLENLVEDMDLREFLPKSEVEVGATWEPSAGALRAMIAPGGGLGLIPTGGEGGMGGMPGMERMDMSSMMSGDFDGTCSAEYKGIREVDGRKLGEILVTFDVSTAVDMTDEVSGMIDEMPDGVQSMEIDHMDIEFTWNGEATIRWDVASGHVASAEAHGDITTRMDTGMQIAAGGREMSIETTFEMSGKVDSKLVVTRQ